MVSILAAQVPAQPEPPVTTFDSDNMIISWVAPDDGGSIITSYTIFVRTSDDSVFLTELVNCDGTNQAIIDNTQCTIPAMTLN